MYTYIYTYIHTYIHTYIYIYIYICTHYIYAVGLPPVLVEEAEDAAPDEGAEAYCTP